MGLQAGATLAAWFRCGVLVRRSLRPFGPSWRGFVEREDYVKAGVGNFTLNRYGEGDCVLQPNGIQ